MRLFPLPALLLIPLFGAPGFAQTTPVSTNPVTSTTGTTPPAEHHARRSAAEHFADANTTHDGRLTLDQAQSGYKSIAKSFAQIDVNHRGYVTMDDIKAWRAAKKAARQAAKRASEDSDSGIVRPVPALQRGNGPLATDAATDSVSPGPSPAPRLGVDLPKTPLDSGKS